MRTPYNWKYTIDERGFKEIPLVDYTLHENKNLDYVEKYLSPSIKHAHCGWDHVTFRVLENQYGREEFVILYPNEKDNNGRYICVSGNSLGAISEAIWNCVFA